MIKKAEKNREKKGEFQVEISREELLEHLPNGKSAEIGVAEGNFSKEILDRNNPKMLYLIDIWDYIELPYNDGNMLESEKQEKRYNLVKEKFKNYQNVKILKETSYNAKFDIEDFSLDWIYIDADHSYWGCFNDLNYYRDKVKQSGYICGHDWLPPKFKKKKKVFEVNEAVIDFVNENGFYLSLITNEKKYKSYVISKNKQAEEKLLKRIKIDHNIRI